MRLFLVKPGVVLVSIFVFSTFLSCSDGKLVNENAELRAKNQELEKQINELKSKIKDQSKQVSKETLAVLEKVEARTKDVPSQDPANPLNYEQYGELMTEMSCSLNRFLQSSESIQNPPLTGSIQKVVTHYRQAHYVWYLQSQSRKSSFKENDPFWKSIVSVYPAAKHNDLDHTKLVIWKAASEELERTRTLFQAKGE
jgi:hypothetical protein